MKFYKRDPDAALGGMAELNFEQRGAYCSLIDLLYARDGIVPDNDVFVCRIFHCSVRTWRRLKIDLIAAGKIWVDEAGLLNANRVAETILSANETSIKQTKRVNQRWQKYRNTLDFNGGTVHTRNTTNTQINKKENSELAPSPEKGLGASNELVALMARKGSQS
jgi:uncharacterized protein YdaU (DUF1376 family)